MAINWPAQEKLRSLITIGISRYELEELGLANKVQVHYLDFPGNVAHEARESFKPGYYEDVEGAWENRRLISLEEAYPSGLIIARGVVRDISDRRRLEIFGAPKGGIKEIDFTHYSLGPSFIASLSENDPVWAVTSQVISFHRRKKD